MRNLLAGATTIAATTRASPAAACPGWSGGRAAGPGPAGCRPRRRSATPVRSGPPGSRGPGRRSGSRPATAPAPPAGMTAWNPNSFENASVAGHSSNRVRFGSSSHSPRNNSSAGVVGLDHEPAAVDQRLRAAEQQRRVPALEDGLKLLDRPLRQRAGFPLQRRQGSASRTSSAGTGRRRRTGRPAPRTACGSGPGSGSPGVAGGGVWVVGSGRRPARRRRGFGRPGQANRAAGHATPGGRRPNRTAAVRAASSQANGKSSDLATTRGPAASAMTRARDGEVGRHACQRGGGTQLSNAGSARPTNRTWMRRDGHFVARNFLRRGSHRVIYTRPTLVRGTSRHAPPDPDFCLDLSFRRSPSRPRPPSPNRADRRTSSVRAASLALRGEPVKGAFVGLYTGRTTSSSGSHAGRNCRRP